MSYPILTRYILDKNTPIYTIRNTSGPTRFPCCANEEHIPATIGSSVNHKSASPIPASGPKSAIFKLFIKFLSSFFSSRDIISPIKNAAAVGLVFINPELSFIAFARPSLSSLYIFSSAGSMACVHPIPCILS